MSAGPTDPTRPVRDQAERDRLLPDLHARYHDQTGNLLGRDDCGWFECDFWPIASTILDDLPRSAYLFAAGTDIATVESERDALRATVDRVRALPAEWKQQAAPGFAQPGSTAHHVSVALVQAADDLRRALDGATQAAPRPGTRQVVFEDRGGDDWDVRIETVTEDQR